MAKGSRRKNIGPNHPDGIFTDQTGGPNRPGPIPADHPGGPGRPTVTVAVDVQSGAIVGSHIFFPPMTDDGPTEADTGPGTIPTS